jgi:FkbH-like protein
MIDNKVKLVVWDLDETFWRGTLTEEGIVPVQRNIDIVAELPKRGILNSICSKNDPGRTKAKLVELGVWDWFVFPSISFNPKGKAVAEMIEGATLRAENVLFIDDNKLNREEVKFFNPGIMTARPDKVLEGLLDHPNLAGKPDPQLTRLKQYKFLQRKVEERSTSDLSNEEFLRASNIRVTIDYEVERNFDRVVELINRTNQLNYTKERLNTPKQIEELHAQLSGFGFHAGTVHAADNYGDYGLIGFFLMKRRANTKRLIHFVFSCRTMNMGIEQFVYESLDRPEIDIVEPVSYGLQSHAATDWITAGGEGESGGAQAVDDKLVLIGGCHLLQLASYCSTNRSEFVNVQNDDRTIRFDDPGFIFSDREVLKKCRCLRRIPNWQYEDALRFDAAVAEAGIVLVALWASMNAVFLRINEDTTMMSLKRGHVDEIKGISPRWFDRHIREMPGDMHSRAEAVLRSFEVMARKTPAACRIFAFGAFTKGGKDDPKKAQRKAVFNDTCRSYCEAHPEKFRYVDLDSIMPADSLVANEHFSRAGYFTLARYILAEMAAPAQMLRTAS